MGDFCQRIMEWRESDQDERRQCGRIRVELLKSNLGRVVDLSATGMKVHCRSWFRPRKKRTRVVLRCIDGISTIPASIVRVQRIGPRTWELGIEFARINDKLRSRLVEIARLAGARRMVDPTARRTDPPADVDRKVARSA